MVLNCEHCNASFLNYDTEGGHEPHPKTGTCADLHRCPECGEVLERSYHPEDPRHPDNE